MKIIPHTMPTCDQDRRARLDRALKQLLNSDYRPKKASDAANWAGPRETTEEMLERTQAMKLRLGTTMREIPVRPFLEEFVGSKGERLLTLIEGGKKE